MIDLSNDTIKVLLLIVVAFSAIEFIRWLVRLWLPRSSVMLDNSQLQLLINEKNQREKELSNAVAEYKRANLELEHDILELRKELAANSLKIEYLIKILSDYVGEEKAKNIVDKIEQQKKTFKNVKRFIKDLIRKDSLKHAIEEALKYTKEEEEVNTLINMFARLESLENAIIGNTISNQDALREKASIRTGLLSFINDME